MKLFPALRIAAVSAFVCFSKPVLSSESSRTLTAELGTNCVIQSRTRQPPAVTTPLLVPLEEEDIRLIDAAFNSRANGYPVSNQVETASNTTALSPEVPPFPAEFMVDLVAGHMEPEYLTNVLQAAFTANGRTKYDKSRPVQVVETNGFVIVRFPAVRHSSTNGMLRYGPTWAKTITLEPDTLRVVKALADPD